MKAREADRLAEELDQLLSAGDIRQAYSLLAPYLDQRIPFAKLGRIGTAIGKLPIGPVNTFLDKIAASEKEGGWVIIGRTQFQQLDRDPGATIQRCRTYIVMADVWYGSDILAERVPGPALVEHFQPTLKLLRPWLQDENRWVRRAIGVGAHHWAKRSSGKTQSREQAVELLNFLEPLFEEWELDAAKGVGWGLKTLGRYYPDLTKEWLISQASRPHRALVLRKALTYLPAEDQDRVRASANGVPQ